jgi:hypothetical protein
MSTDAADALRAGVDYEPARMRAVPGTAWWRRAAPRALQVAAAAWFAVTLVGQWIMAYYVFALYGLATLRGDAQGWNTVMAHGHVPGDAIGNGVIAAHVAVACLVLAGGGVQLVPAVRRGWPTFHRWNGRIYLAAIAVLCAAGMTVQLTRASQSTVLFSTAFALNVALVVAFGGLALRAAVARRIDAHRRWALRLFLAVSGSWFFRVLLMAWIVANQGPVGFDPKTFDGPTIRVLAYAQYLLPLAVLEFYFRAQRGGPAAKWAMAGGLGVATLVTAGGVAAATMLMWLPRL